MTDTRSLGERIADFYTGLDAATELAAVATVFEQADLAVLRAVEFDYTGDHDPTPATQLRDVLFDLHVNKLAIEALNAPADCRCISRAHPVDPAREEVA